MPKRNLEPLDECPFCGKRQAALHETEYGHPRFYVKCVYCGVSTRAFGSEEEAHMNWNTRVKPKVNVRIKPKTGRAKKP